MKDGFRVTMECIDEDGDVSRSVVVTEEAETGDTWLCMSGRVPIGIAIAHAVRAMGFARPLKVIAQAVCELMECEDEPAHEHWDGYTYEHNAMASAAQRIVEEWQIHDQRADGATAE
jgi:fructose-1,6-bisphosphatase/sedoheptulose 1,7-bisphosphatase-like protein